MGGRSETAHPDPAILALFAAGRLRDAEMLRLEEHLADCSVCLGMLDQVPEDPIVPMLRDCRSQLFREASVARSEPKASGEADHLDEGASGYSSSVDQDPTGSFQPDRNDAAGRLLRDLDEHPRYRVRSMLDRGGMGVVFVAEDRSEGRPVVLKFLRDDLVDDPDMVERFRRESAAAARLKHPNIVEVLGIEQFGPSPALVLEFIEGTDLARLVERKGPVPVSVGCSLVRQAAIGLQYSFEQGMVHRDIKPSNLMLTKDGTVKILDFGLARMSGELSNEPNLTGTGVILGSIDYMVPEQADDPRLVNIRGDIYSLGCTLYYLLSGRAPFQGSALQVLKAHHWIVARLLSDVRPEIPVHLAALVARMMAKDPDERFQNPAELAQALEAFSSMRNGTVPSAPENPPAQPVRDRRDVESRCDSHGCHLPLHPEPGKTAPRVQG